MAHGTGGTGTAPGTPHRTGTPHRDTAPAPHRDTAPGHDTAPGIRHWDTAPHQDMALHRDMALAHGTGDTAPGTRHHGHPPGRVTAVPPPLGDMEQNCGIKGGWGDFGGRSPHCGGDAVGTQGLAGDMRRRGQRWCHLHGHLVPDIVPIPGTVPIPDAVLVPGDVPIEDNVTVLVPGDVSIEDNVPILGHVPIPGTGRELGTVLSSVPIPGHVPIPS